MLGLTQTGQVGVESGDVGIFVAEVDLDLPQVLTLFEQVRGVRVAQGVNRRGLADPAGVQGQAEGALEGGTVHGFGGGGGAPTVVALGGE